jgi:hypothetical protein
LKNLFLKRICYALTAELSETGIATSEEVRPKMNQYL